MKVRARTVGLVVTLLAMTGGFTGCSMGWKSAHERDLEIQVEQLKGRLEESDNSRQGFLDTIDQLQKQIAQLQNEKTEEIQRLTEEKTQENQDLLDAQKRLAESLKQELKGAQAKLAMTERGLVVTFLDEIFFDSGKSQVKLEGMEALEKVATVLKENVPDSTVAVEGYTDDQPIKYSSWRSNWELSSARALAVVHYFIDKQRLEPVRLRAVGFGEHHPVASNDTPEGRRQNRRVEVVIVPRDIKKSKAHNTAADVVY